MRKFLHQILILVQFVHRTASLVFTLNAENVIQNLDVQIIGFEPWHERRQHKGFIFLVDIYVESMLVILNPTTGYTATGSSLTATMSLPP